jgi:uncharacterized protein YlxP (DUF503 family)
MFVCVARVSLDIPAAGSLKAKRQVLRKVTDRVKARFNVSVAEVDGHDAWQRAVIALCLVGNEKAFVNEQMDKVLHFIEEMYVAPVTGRELEILSFGDQLFQGGGSSGESFLELPVQHGERSLAEAEGMGSWEERNARPTAPSPSRAKAAPTEARGKPGLEEARAKARALRNKREWER